MSLLNQVLQDLEKRNVNHTLEHYSLNDLKAVAATPKKSVFLPISIFLIGTLFLINLYWPNEQQPSAIEFISQTQPTTIAKQKIQIKQKPVQAIAAENIEHSIEKTGISSDIDNEDHSFKVIEKQSKETKPLAKKTYKQLNVLTANPPSIKPQVKKKRKRKTLSYRQQSERFFSKAKKQKIKNERQLILEKALILYPQHIKARLLLSKTFLELGLSNKTAEILDQGLKLFPQNLQFIILRSQLHLQKKQSQAALKILSIIDSEYIQDETYLSLLAAAYQQENLSIKSQQTYSKLLKINPEKAEYWLGLAIAQEKQGKSAKALKSYQQAIDKNTLKIVIVDYIKQRISLLK